MNLLVPPGVAAAVFITSLTGYAAIHNESLNGQSAHLGIIVTYVAYFVAIVPSAIFAAAMEWVYRKKGVRPDSLRAVRWSTFGGAFAGFGISLMLLQPFRSPARLYLMYVALGTVTGLIVGLLVKLVERQYTKNAAGRNNA